MHINPKDLPELRARIVQQRRIVGAEQLASLHLNDNLNRLVAMTPEEMASATTASLALADLFYVSNDMAYLAFEASKSLPVFTADAEDFPSRRGLIFFDGGVQVTWGGFPVSLHAVSWEVGAEAAYFAPYLDIRSAIDVICPNPGMEENLLKHTKALGALSDDIWYGECSRGVIRFRTDESEEEQGVDRAALSASAYLLLTSALLMMQQPVTTTSDAEYTRADRRRLARRNITTDRVRVIQLRRSSSAGHGESDREYHHQWIVRGHWRQQWYATRGVHRPVWIAPHLKGPDGAPLLGGEKVHAWTR